MAPENQAIKKLKQCMKTATTQGDRDACQAAFEQESG